MKKILIAATILISAASNVLAGGLMTNTNQSASFLRNPARDAVIDIDGVYTNPAGVGFLPLGFHLAFTIQHPEQQRNVTTSFPTLALNANRLGETTHHYKGQASAPVVPSFQAAYVRDRWSLHASFAICGGGGKCEFDNGIGSIESVLSLVPMAVAKQNGVNIGKYIYSMESSMKGRQYYYGIQLGGSYKVTDRLAVALGIRSVIADATYSGHVRNISFTSIDANAATMPYTNLVLAKVNAAMQDIEMETDQTCTGWLPVIGIDYRLNEHWNFAAKYEFRAKMNAKNKSKMNDMARSLEALDKYNDQKVERVRDDVPQTITVGVQYSPIEQVRLSLSAHHYDDRNAVKYNNEQKLIDHGTHEALAGVEWDANKFLTVSCGWQRTMYAVSDEYMQDMSFNLSSNMMALGCRLNLSDKVNVDLGYMLNFYEDRTVTTNDYQGTGLSKTDKYERKNAVVAVGVNFKF